MRTERLRGLFSQFLKENEMDNALLCNSCITIAQDESLKYERIDKYNVLFLTYKDLKKLLAFCDKHGISVWFGADKLCIGFNYCECMRLSAYDSVHPESSGLGCQEDRRKTDHNFSVLPGSQDLDHPEDRNDSVQVPNAAEISQGDRNAPVKCFELII